MKFINKLCTPFKFIAMIFGNILRVFIPEEDDEGDSKVIKWQKRTVVKEVPSKPKIYRKVIYVKNKAEKDDKEEKEEKVVLEDIKAKEEVKQIEDNIAKIDEIVIEDQAAEEPAPDEKEPSKEDKKVEPKEEIVSTKPSPIADIISDKQKEDETELEDDLDTEPEELSEEQSIEKPEDISDHNLVILYAPTKTKLVKQSINKEPNYKLHDSDYTKATDVQKVPAKMTEKKVLLAESTQITKQIEEDRKEKTEKNSTVNKVKYLLNKTPTYSSYSILKNISYFKLYNMAMLNNNLVKANNTLGNKIKYTKISFLDFFIKKRLNKKIEQLSYDNVFAIEVLKEALKDKNISKQDKEEILNKLDRLERYNINNRPKEKGKQKKLTLFK